MKKIFCKNCTRFYMTEADQCEIPDCGMRKLENFDNNTIRTNNPKQYSIAVGRYDQNGIDFLEGKIKFYSYTTSIKKDNIFGHPSDLNKNNDCYFYKERRLLEVLKSIFRNQ